MDKKMAFKIEFLGLVVDLNQKLKGMLKISKSLA